MAREIEQELNRDQEPTEGKADEGKIAIKIENVSKRYRIGMIGGRTLQKDLQSWWAKKRGLPDPNLPIGMEHRLVGETFMALQDINLTIYQGETVGIIGNNGAGKSTLLKLLSQITAPTTGDIDLYGRVTSMLEIGTGFHGEMSGRDNIYMNGAILGMKKHEIDEIIEDIIDYSEVRDFIDTPVKRYSSGMFVKLAFSVAAHLNSEIMIMDEVLAVGDMAFQEKCLNKMRSIAVAEGRTVLYVSHNMNTIRKLCDRCIVLHDGKVVFDGATDEAIAIYMRRSLGEDDVNIDLSKAEHVKLPYMQVNMLELNLLDKVQAIYAEDDILKLRLRLFAYEEFKAAKVRLTLRNDADVGIASSWSEQIDLSKGESSIYLSMPLNGIKKGTFYVSIGVYDADELGREIMLDHITRAFSIRFPGKPNWYTAAHGYINLPALSVDRVESEARDARE